MKFGQLLEYNMRSIFLNHTQNVAEKLIFFLKKSKFSIYLWINNLKICTVGFSCITNWELAEHIGTKLQITYFYLI